MIVPRNMEGAGSMRLANYLYNAAPKDGTSFGTINRGTGFEPLLGNKGAQFDATRYNWIGSTNNEVSAEADKAGLEINPVAGEDIQRLVSQVYATPAAIVRKTVELLQ